MIRFPSQQKEDPHQAQQLALFLQAVNAWCKEYASEEARTLCTMASSCSRLDERKYLGHQLHCCFHSLLRDDEYLIKVTPVWVDNGNATRGSDYVYNSRYRPLVVGIFYLNHHRQMQPDSLVLILRFLDLFLFNHRSI